MKKLDQRPSPKFFAVMIAVTVAAFVWIAHSSLLVASPFFIAGTGYGFLLYSVVKRSGRAFLVMHCALFMMSIPLLQLQDALEIPVGGSAFAGFWAGLLASGYPWSEKPPGSEERQQRDSTTEDVQGYTGGRDIALINAACVVFVLGCAIAHLAFQIPTAPAAAVLTGLLICAWAFFRFTPSLVVRNVLLLVIPVTGFGLLAFLDSMNGPSVIPFAWAYGSMAGVLLGGRYWSGPRLGQPRPPFSGQASPKRKRRTVRRSLDKQKQNEAPAGRR